MQFVNDITIKTEIMEIKTKFKLGETVFFMHSDRVESAEITAKFISVYGGYDVVRYKTCFGDMVMEEEKLFTSKEELLKSL